MGVLDADRVKQLYGGVCSLLVPCQSPDLSHTVHRLELYVRNCARCRWKVILGS